MIISDLNYLEVINEAGVVGGTGGITVDKDVDIDFDSSVDITGNLATVTFDVTAIGNNTVAEADISVVATDGLSEASGSLFAAVD